MEVTLSRHCSTKEKVSQVKVIDGGYREEPVKALGSSLDQSPLSHPIPCCLPDSLAQNVQKRPEEYANELRTLGSPG